MTGAGTCAPSDTASSTLVVPFFPGYPHTGSLLQWRTQIAQGLAQGQRLLSLFGRGNAPTPDVVVTALLLGKAGLRVIRGQGTVGDTYPSLSAEFPQAQIYERELWEQTGIVPAQHPWLKPVRFEGQRLGQCETYPFFSMRGAELHEVGVGPIHAGVIEPGHFRFICHGETVHHLEIQLGYQHRGVEALLLQRPPHRHSALVESMVGDSVIAYASAFHTTLEHLSLQPPPAAVRASRAVALELERIAMHVSTLSGLAMDLAFVQAGATYQRLRTAIINATQGLCGNRFGRGWIRPGGATALNRNQRAALAHTLERFLRDFVQVNHLVRTRRSVRARFQGIGVLAAPAPTELGLSGVIARASGVALDLRSALPDALMGAPAPITEPGGDCWARMVLRMREAETSTHWLLERLGDAALDLDCAPPRTPQPGAHDWPLLPHALGLSVVEGVRGPVLVALETGPTGQLVHAKVQDPSLANWFGLAQALRGQQISDFPICNKSFDLSYCGNDL